MAGRGQYKHADVLTESFLRQRYLEDRKKGEFAEFCGYDVSGEYCEPPQEESYF